MAISAFDIFKIGIGPSSSHTVGPMRAARMFVEHLRATGMLVQCARVRTRLYGSLGATGKGHGSDKAVLLGLEGHDPESVDVDRIAPMLATIRASQRLRLAGQHDISFVEKDDLTFMRREVLPLHANGMRFVALDAVGKELSNRCYYSVGGGFVIADRAADDGTPGKALVDDTTVVPYPFHSARELLERANAMEASIARPTFNAAAMGWRAAWSLLAGP
jgi:L-serine dehydratase